MRTVGIRRRAAGLRFIAVIAVLSLVACGGSPIAPSPTVLSGRWTGALERQPCAGDWSAITLELTQSGSTLGGQLLTNDGLTLPVTGTVVTRNGDRDDRRGVAAGHWRVRRDHVRRRSLRPRRAWQRCRILRPGHRPLLRHHRRSVQVRARLKRLFPSATRPADRIGRVGQVLCKLSPRAARRVPPGGFACGRRFDRYGPPGRLVVVMTCAGSMAPGGCTHPKAVTAASAPRPRRQRARSPQ